MPRRNRTIEEMLARTTVDDLARVPSTNPVVRETQDRLASSQRDLQRRGIQPAQRIAREAPAQERPTTGAHRAGQWTRDNWRTLAAEATGWPSILRAGQNYYDHLVRPITDPIADFGRGITGMQPRELPQAPARPAVPSAPAPGTPSVTAASAQPSARQTSFTNEDAEGLADQVMTMPAIEVPQEPTALEQALTAAIERMAPPRQQATLIRHTPERRLTGSPRERREQLRAEGLDVAREQVRQAEQTQSQAQRQQAIQEQATLLATMRSQEQALTAQLMQLQAQAVDGTPEGRLAAARAAQIEEALVRIRAARAAGEITLEQEIGFLTGSADTRQPIQDMMGGIAGTFSSTTGRPELFPADVREQLSPNLRR